jgi:phage-related protein
MNNGIANTIFDGGRKLLDVGAKGIRSIYDGIKKGKDWASNVPVLGPIVRPFSGIIDNADGLVSSISNGLSNSKNLLNNIQSGDINGISDSFKGMKNDAFDTLVKSKNLLM